MSEYKQHAVIPQWSGRCIEMIAADQLEAGRRLPLPALGVLAGEGIGPEVIAAAMKVLDAVQEVRLLHLPRRTGPVIEAPPGAGGEGALSDAVADFCQGIFAENGAVLCGPGGGRFVYDMRRRFDLFCKLVPLCPVRALRGASPLKPELLDGVDILMVRDNAAGVYQGQWGTRGESKNACVAEHQFSYSREQVERIVAVAARFARVRRGQLHVVVKDGGVPSISDLWRATAQDIASQTGINCAFINADYAAYLLVREPRRFDVMVAPNMLGDILADLGAVFLGSRGLSFSANFSAAGHAVYQTGHGAAKDLAGTDRANPIGQIHSLSMMLRESYGLLEEADLIERAVEQVLRAGYRTDDLAEPGCRLVGTQKMADLIAQAVSAQALVPT